MKAEGSSHRRRERGLQAHHREGPLVLGPPGLPSAETPTQQPPQGSWGGGRWVLLGIRLHPAPRRGGAGNGLRWKQQVEPSCGGARREARVTPQTGHPGGGGEHPTRPAQGSPRDTEPSRQPAPPQGGPDTAQGLGCPLLPSRNLGPGVQHPTPLYGFLPSPGSSAGPARAAVPRPCPPWLSPASRHICHHRASCWSPSPSRAGPPRSVPERLEESPACRGPRTSLGWWPGPVSWE